MIQGLELIGKDFKVVIIIIFSEKKYVYREIEIINKELK